MEAHRQIASEVRDAISLCEMMEGHLPEGVDVLDKMKNRVALARALFQAGLDILYDHKDET